MTKHTPGPWRVGQTLAGGPSIESKHDKRLAVALVGMHRDGPEAYANALLIAAAPDLLKALKALVALHNKVDPEGYFIGREQAEARLAIDRAEAE